MTNPEPRTDWHHLRIRRSDGGETSALGWHTKSGPWVLDRLVGGDARVYPGDVIDAVPVDVVVLPATSPLKKLRAATGLNSAEVTAVLQTLSHLGLVVLDAARVAALERKNANLGRFVNGQAPEGYVLVKAVETP